MKNEQKNNGATAETQRRLTSTAEKAQYEVFRNGKVPRERIAEWLERDLDSIRSLVYELRFNADLKEALVDVYYARYQELTSAAKDEVQSEK